MTTNAQAALAAAARLGAADIHTGSAFTVEQLLETAADIKNWLDDEAGPEPASVVHLATNHCQATRGSLSTGKAAQCELVAGHTGLHIYGKARA